MDIRIHLGRRAVLLVVLVLGLLAAAGVAYATIPDAGGVYTACKLNATGTIRLIDPSGPSSSLLSHCTAIESQIVWNQKGQPGAPGKDGSSPTVAQLQAGDSHCPTGGASIADASSHIAYVCNGATGATGADGQPGQPGKDGAPFNGTFTSPNGEFTLTVDNGGVSVVGPDASISLPSAGGIIVDASQESTTVSGDRTESVGGNESLNVSGNRTEDVHGSETLSVADTRTENVGVNENVNVGANRTERVGATLKIASGASTSIVATLLGLNDGSGCSPAARAGDPVTSSVILIGSPTVCIGG
jgi:hypothetical protein